MKILIVHQYYLFPGAGGGSRFNALAQRFAEVGHAVAVIAGNEGVIDACPLLGI